MIDLDEGERLLAEAERCSCDPTVPYGLRAVTFGRWENWRAINTPALIAELRAARETIMDYENREAGCCPEDCGFVEWIAVLLRRLAAANETITAQAETIAALRGELECERTKGTCS